MVYLFYIVIGVPATRNSAYMTFLQKLHTTIQMLGIVYDDIPISAIARVLKAGQNDITAGIDNLIALGVIERASVDKIVLTEKGKLAHVL